MPFLSGDWEGELTVYEQRGVVALVKSMAICVTVGFFFRWIGRGPQKGMLYQKEAMAVVGLSWILATLLGALPYYLGAVQTSPGNEVTFIESMFESQSGFSTTGATILTDLESAEFVPRCILFWRSWTHFLGGLGIVVLFVAILGQGSSGKAMMRAEMPGPNKEGSKPRMQHTALVFASIYVSLNVILTFIYLLEGMNLFDAACHAFGTMATGGFSTHNASLGHFDSPAIEYTTVLFMVLAGTNFSLLYLTLIGDPKRLLRDTEFRTFIAIIAAVTAGIILFGVRAGDAGFENFSQAFRQSLFQVVSVLTTTGYGTADYDQWNAFARGILLLMMFVGGCAGSTGGGLKVIRHVLFYKILRLEIEKSHRPRVIRSLRIGGKSVDEPNLPHAIVVYFSIILALFVFSWLLLITFEPNNLWDGNSDLRSQHLDGVNQELAERERVEEKLLDLASAVAATLNNIGPGLGVVGPVKNYAEFSQGSKLLFVWLMMLGRVEVFSVLVLIFPSFWRRV